MIVRFTVPGPPVGYERTGGGRTRQRFKPTKTRRFMESVQSRWFITVAGRLPADFNAKRIRVACWYVNGVHPDGDNVLKAVIDALKGRAYKGDDRKLGGSFEPPLFDKENPRTVVEVLDE